MVNVPLLNGTSFICEMQSLPPIVRLVIFSCNQVMGMGTVFPDVGCFEIVDGMRDPFN
jgi:hypothetical protein